MYQDDLPPNRAASRQEKLGTRVVIDFPELHWIPGCPHPVTYDNTVAHFYGTIRINEAGKFFLCSEYGFDETGDSPIYDKVRKLSPILTYLQHRLRDEINELNTTKGNENITY
jgi:hypothetical protein